MASFLGNALQRENSAQVRQLPDCCLHNNAKIGAFSYENPKRTVMATNHSHSCILRSASLGLLLILVVHIDAAMGQTEKVTKAKNADGQLVIEGRPEAPLLNSKQLPLPRLPAPVQSSAFEELDSSDFLRNPELLLIKPEANFEFSLQKLQAEVRQIEGQSAPAE
jgi:hypothetical protein